MQKQASRDVTNCSKALSLQSATKIIIITTII